MIDNKHCTLYNNRYENYISRTAAKEGMRCIFLSDAVTVMRSFCQNATDLREGGKNDEAQSGYFFAVFRRMLPMQRFGGFSSKSLSSVYDRAFLYAKDLL